MYVTGVGHFSSHERNVGNNLPWGYSTRSARLALIACKEHGVDWKEHRKKTLLRTVSKLGVRHRASASLSLVSLRGVDFGL